MKEYRVKYWDDEDGEEYADYYDVRPKVPAQQIVDNLKEAGWDNVILQYRGVTSWEEV